MEDKDLLRHAVEALERLGLRYLVTGSMATIFFGEPEYYREGGSEKHLRDITGVLRISGEKIDRSYIKEWAERLGLEDIWQMILERLEPAHPDPRAS